jgi:LTXXQ motif family protein
MKRAYCSIIATVALAAASITQVAAQERPASPGSTMTPGRGMSGLVAVYMMGRAMMATGVSMAGQIEPSIAYLKTELKITDAQMPQWDAFANSLRNNAKRIAELRNTFPSRPAQAAGITVADRIDRAEKLATEWLDIVKSTKAAAAPLYLVLTDEQKKIANGVWPSPDRFGE